VANGQDQQAARGRHAGMHNAHVGVHDAHVGAHDERMP
jgi:hypothetical protein